MLSADHELINNVLMNVRGGFLMPDDEELVSGLKVIRPKPHDGSPTGI